MDEDFMGRSISAAVAWHREQRARARARGVIRTIYYRALPEAPAEDPFRTRTVNLEREAFNQMGSRQRQRLIVAIGRVQGDNCYLCGLPFAKPFNTPTLDHVWPLGRDGVTRDNLLLAHRGCNHLKDDRLPYPCELLFLASVNEQRKPVATPAQEVLSRAG